MMSDGQNTNAGAKNQLQVNALTPCHQSQERVSGTDLGEVSDVMVLCIQLVNAKTSAGIHKPHHVPQTFSGCCPHAAARRTNGGL